MSTARKARLGCTVMLAWIALCVGGSVLTGTYEPEVGGVAVFALVVTLIALHSIRPTTKAPDESGAFARKG